MLWTIDPAARWSLMEGDVAITHAVRVEGLVDIKRGSTRISAVREASTVVPWIYELVVGEEVVTISASVIWDVVYAHETLESAGAHLLLQAESAVKSLQGIG
jgi:hypothetical protein